MENSGSIAKQKLIKSFFHKFPMESAIILDSFPVNKIIQYLKSMTDEQVLEVFSRLNPEIAATVVNEMDDKLFIRIYSKIDTHLGARILSRLGKEKINSRLELLPGIQTMEIRDFMAYSPTSAGYLMETNVITFNVDNVVRDVLKKIRKNGDKQILAVYIIDETGNLAGKIPIQVIAGSRPDHKLGKHMVPAPHVNAMSSKEDVLEILEKENLIQVPVTDINNKLLGIIRNDALISAAKQELSENMQAMFGAGREEQALSKVSYAVKKRLPWLQVNLATAFLASMVVGLFEDTIAQITILAIFLPVVAGQSGNTGSQALAVTMRGLALREIRISQWFKVAKKELFVGFINGVAVALTTGLIVFFWASSLGIAIVIAISMVLSMMIAGFSGAAIPMALKAFGQDPATSSSIILTTITDITGFFSFLGLATALASALGIT